MNASIRLLLVDDEAPARVRLRNLLEDIAPDSPNQVLAEAADGVEALQKIGMGDAVDVVLTDIRMPRMDGVELARHLGVLPQPPAVIFVTAYDEYAVKAFELSAIDYLLKPVKAERLAAALAKSRPLTTNAAALRSLSPQRRHLRCVERGRVLLIPVAEVLFFKAELKYVTARTARREYVLEEALLQLEEEFRTRFMRIHRNCIVARDAVSGVERCVDPEQPGGLLRWALILRDCNEKLLVSRRQWAHVKEQLGV